MYKILLTVHDTSGISKCKTDLLENKLQKIHYWMNLEIRNNLWKCQSDEQYILWVIALTFNLFLFYSNLVLSKVTYHVTLHIYMVRSEHNTYIVLALTARDNEFFDPENLWLDTKITFLSQT